MAGEARTAKPETFCCEKFRAELTGRACRINQEKGRLDPEGMERDCPLCDVGRVFADVDISEVNFGRRTSPPGPGKSFSVTPPPSPPLEAPPAPARVVKPCKNHPEREAEKNGKCRECNRAYQKEWYAEKKAKKPQTREKLKVQKPDSKLGSPPVVIIPPSYPGPGDLEVPPCKTCGQAPAVVNRDGMSTGKCRTCMAANLKANLAKTDGANRTAKMIAKTKAAYGALRLLEAGELVERAERFAGVWALVSGLQAQVEASALENLRSVEAELAFRLRGSFGDETV